MCAPGTVDSSSGTGSTSLVCRSLTRPHASARARAGWAGFATPGDDRFPNLWVMGAGHDHAARRAHDRARLRVVLLLTVAVAVLELVGAALSGSLALLADAGHMFTDATAVVLALSASYVATLPATPRRTFGYHRAEILAALVNAMVLLGVCGYLLVAGVRRLADPVDVDVAQLLGFATRWGWWPTSSPSGCWSRAAASR